MKIINSFIDKFLTNSNFENKKFKKIVEALIEGEKSEKINNYDPKKHLEKLKNSLK